MFMIEQLEITLQPKSRGFHLVTGEIMRQLLCEFRNYGRARGLVVTIIGE